MEANAITESQSRCRYLVSDAAIAQSLASCRELGEAIPGESRILSFSDSYYDTKDGQLLGLGWMLRLRQAADSKLLCLKKRGSPSGQHSPDCLEEAFTGVGIDRERLPEEVGKALENLIGPAALQAIVSFSQERCSIPLFRDRAKIAELNLDALSFAPGSKARSNPLIVAGLRLTALGSPSDLADIRGELEDRYGLSRSDEDKLSLALAATASPLSRGQGLHGPSLSSATLASLPLAAAADESPSEESQSGDVPGKKISLARSASEPSIIDLARSSLQKSAAELRKALAGFEKKGDADSIHDLRVASRRLLVALDLFKEYLDKDECLHLRKLIRRLGKSSGFLRDVDILRESSASHLARLSQKKQEGFKAFPESLSAKRARGMQELLADVRGLGIKLLACLGDLDPKARSGGPQPSARNLAPVFIFKIYALLIAAGEQLGQKPPESVDAYHELRKLIKNLRYTLEIFSPVLGPASSDCLSALVFVQDRLGALSDSAAAIQLIREDFAPGKPQPSPELASYLALRQEEQRRLLRSFPRDWARLTSSGFRKKLFLALAS